MGSSRPRAVRRLPYADITNPQSLNKYAYTYNNPLRYNDPTGHVCLFGWGTTCKQPDPPPPPPPPMSPEASKAFLLSLGSQKVNTLNVAQAGNVVYNESGTVKPGKAGAAELEKGRIATANATMNGDVKLGTSRPETASTTVSASAAGTPQYQQSQLAAAQAYYGRTVNGTDTAGGRMFFNNRFNDYMGPRITEGGKEENVYQRYGPFEANGQSSAYIVIYDDPR